MNGKHPTNPNIQLDVLKVDDFETIMVADMVKRIMESDREDKKVVLICPNPSPTYTRVAYMLHALNVNCRNVKFYMMDEWADEDGNIAPLSYKDGFGRILQYINDNSAANISSNYKRVMAKCLAENKAERYASVDEIMEVLFNKSRRTKLVSSAALLILLAILFFAFDAPRYIHRGLYGYDFADDEGVLYNVLDKDSMTCRVVGYCAELDQTNSIDYGHVVIPEVISYRDAFYNVTEMADSAFFKDSVITMLSVMPKKIVVGKSCFSHASKLQYVTFAGEAQLHESTFSYDYKLSTIDYPKNLRVIPHLCFFQNNAIQHLNCQKA